MGASTSLLGNGAEIDDPMPAGAIPKKSAPKYWNLLLHHKANVTFKTDLGPSTVCVLNECERRNTRIRFQQERRWKNYRGPSGRGVRFMDYDNDGWNDVFIVQAHVTDNVEVITPGLRYRESAWLLHDEEEAAFTDVSPLSGDFFQHKPAARAWQSGI